MCLNLFKFLNQNHLLILLSGSVPLIISGFCKFDIHGPFKIFNGLIIWFQKKIELALLDYSIKIIKFMVHNFVQFGVLSQKNMDQKFYFHFSISIFASLYLTFSAMACLIYFYADIFKLYQFLCLFY